jgi:alkanesulfonate monooxygenase SsuD/methylene tetrahydromethanopterin reductase-like flavin-dependent oxidoreductase (luciferase family)
LDFIKNCGVMVEPQEGMPVDELLDVVSSAEKNGYGYFFRSDHLLPTSRKTGLDSPECWVTLGAIAVRTKKIKFGPMVTPIGWRNPALFARMACTVNSLAHGRLQLGVGAGWYGEEYRTHGFEFPDLKGRKQQFREALKIIRPLTQTGKVDFDGKFFSAHLEGLPRLKDRIHLIIGGKAPSVVRQTVAFGDEWNFYTPVPEQFDALKGILDSGSRHIEISRMGPFMVAGSTAQLKTRLRKQMRTKGVSKDEDVYLRELRKNGWLVGTEGDFPERVNELRERGVEKFYFQVWDTKEIGQMELLASILKGM